MAEEEIHGRLGNQLFQYASIRGILNSIGSNEKINISFKKVYEKNFNNDLKNFNLKYLYETKKIKLTLKQFFLLNYMKGIERIITLFYNR